MNLSSPPFRSDSLKAFVDKATYQRGRQLFLDRRVLSSTQSVTDRREYQIQGRVRSSLRTGSYDVDVTLTVSDAELVTAFRGQCSCPMAHDCKHCVALAMQVGNTVMTLPDMPESLAVSAEKQPAVTIEQSKSSAVDVAAELQAIYRKVFELQAQEKSLREKSGAAARQDAAQARQAAALAHAQQQAERQVTSWLDLLGQSLSAALDEDVTRPVEASAPADFLVFTLSSGRVEQRKVLRLGYGLSRRLKNGNWAKLKEVHYLTEGSFPDADLEAARLIERLSPGHSGGYSYGAHDCIPNGAAGLLALKLAAATGKLFFCPEERVLGPSIQLGPTLPICFSWQEGQPSTLSKAWPMATQAAEPVWALLPQIDAALEGELFFNTPPLYLRLKAAECGLLDLPGVSAKHLQALLKAPPIPQSAFERHETTFLRNLAGLPLPPVLNPPEVIQGITPQACLHLSATPPDEVAKHGLLRASLQFDYGGLKHYTRQNHSPVLIEQPDASRGPNGIKRLMLHRDLPAEQRAQDYLRLNGLSGDGRGRFGLPLNATAQHQWLRWLDDDFAEFKAAGFVISTEPQLNDWISRADALDVQMTGSDGESDSGQSPWFDLSLGMLINGERRNILPLLPALLSQLGDSADPEGAGQNLNQNLNLQLPPFVYLPQADEEGNSYFLRLPTEPLRPWLQALLELVGERGGAAGQFDADALRLSRLEALRIGASLGAHAQWQGADKLREMVSQLAGRSSLPEVAAPEGLMATLRPYQLHGLAWLQFLRATGLAGILADDMGLGKTLQALAHILMEKQAGRLDLPALIIAPVSLMGNWRKEASRFTPTLRTLVLHGTGRHEVAGDIASHDIVIAPYSLLQRDRERWLGQAWHIVVLDEAQNIKNANSHAAQIVSDLNTRHRLCLTGTPMENHLGELWSLFHFLMPGFLGSQGRFKLLFRTPIEKLGDSERADQLRLRVTPFMLRRHKRDVATDLPDKQVAISSVELGDAQADLYETIRLTTEKTVQEALASKGLAQSQIQILDALLKLRQVCCDPRLVAVPAAKKVKHSAKLDLLMELLPELLAEGRKVLLFSQFTSMLELIEVELAKRSIEWVKLTGQSQKRDALIERFTSGEVPLFLISLKAGGVGLNLTQADTVIHYDPWWNPATETQATDRAHRIGQTQRVMVYKLVAQGTIEERILALQERKAALAESMYSGAAERKQPLFTENDLAALLRPLGGS